MVVRLRRIQAGYPGGGSTGYQKVALEANLNLTEMCQAALDIGAVEKDLFEVIGFEKLLEIERATVETGKE